MSEIISSRDERDHTDAFFEKKKPIFDIECIVEQLIKIKLQ